MIIYKCKHKIIVYDGLISKWFTKLTREQIVTSYFVAQQEINDKFFKDKYKDNFVSLEAQVCNYDIIKVVDGTEDYKYFLIK